MPRRRIPYRSSSPSPSDSSDEPLDEEHQDHLITSLRTSDAARTALYKKSFLAIPLLAAALILISSLADIFKASSGGSDTRGGAAGGGAGKALLILLLSISSLTCTAYILHFIPIAPPPPPPPTSPSPPSSSTSGSYTRPASFSVDQDDAGPINTYLPLLNALLASLLLLAALQDYRKDRLDRAWREALPALVFGMVMLVRKQLVLVDLGELESRKYDYKGA